MSSSFTTFIKKLQKDTFENVIVPADHPEGIDGWMVAEFQQHFINALQRVNNKTPFIIEVGSWKGLSSNFMAGLCKSNGMSPTIVCVDTWLGSPEHMEGENCSDGLKRVNGIPTIFDEFLKNTKFHKNHDVIHPFPIASMQAAFYMKKKDVKADIIYIDAGHEYESVLMDARLYWDVLKEDGIMIFDDWKWPGVNKAITEFASCHLTSLLNIGEYQCYMVKKSI